MSLSGWAEISPCEQCGARDWSYSSFWLQFRYWLKFGGPRGSAPRTCKNCGHRVEFGGGYGWRRLSYRPMPSVVRVALAPVWLVVALRQARRACPAPWIYFAAAFLGLPIGALLDLTFELPWWLGPPFVVAATWLVFLSTARRNVRMFAGAFLNLSVPRYAAKLSERRSERRIRGTDLPLYGLPPSWTGLRLLGGYGTDGSRMSSLELAHGNLLDESSPELRVETSVFDPPPVMQIIRRQIAHDFMREVRKPPAGISPDDFHLWVIRTHNEIRDAPDPEWRSIRLPVDDQVVEFEILREGSSWVAFAVIDGYVVRLLGKAMKPEEVALVRITDLEPYIEGGQSLRELSG